MSALDRLAARMGVIDGYHGFDRVWRPASPDTRRALLAAMGCAAATEAEAALTLAEAEARDAARRAPREAIARAGAPVAIPVRGAMRWRLTREDGARLEGAGDGEIALPPLPAGLHAIALRHRGGRETIRLIVAPARAPLVADLAGAARIWGVTGTLYGLRTARDLGLGDYADLGAAAAGLAAHGAGFFGVNPVHALGAGEISPYSPSHRGFFNAAHLAIDAVPGFDDCAAARRILDANAAVIAAQRRGELIDYAALAPIRAAALAALFAQSETRAPDPDFTRFRAAQGRALADFALFEAIGERHGPDWRAWPSDLRSPEAPGVAGFARNHADRTRFHQWLQWIADRQIGAAQGRARAAGMALGLYLDVAVGARPGGAELWADRGALAAGASLGAPPDDFSPEGQNWTLAPFAPRGLAAAGYAPFVAMLRVAMKHAGMIRIDHALGLSRSFWIPENGAPGGYVGYPLKALLAVIAIEATRARCLVVGEDLGLVPPGFRDRLAAAGLYGCAVMQFERDAAGGFRDPRDWRTMSLASFATHDTPTLAGLRAGRDIDWARRLGRMTPTQAAAARAARGTALAALEETCGGTDADAVHGALARAGSALVAAQIDDAFGVEDQQNLPGAVEGHPNWRRRDPVPADRLAQAPQLARIGAVMARAGRAPRRRDPS